MEYSPHPPVPSYVFLNYLQRTLPDTHMAGPHLLLLVCIAIVSPSHISCFKGRAEGWL